MMWSDLPVAYAVQHTTVPVSAGPLDVQPGGNGGVRIEKGIGTAYSITACLGAGAPTREEAQRAVDAVKLTIEGNRVRLVNTTGAGAWSVQLVIEAPAGAQITAATQNGPISIDGVDGRIRATASNGPISVTGSRGDFDVETKNGPISVSLEGSRWEGTLDARAQNGPLSVHVPQGYTTGVEIFSSAHAPWSCHGTACGSNRDDRGWGRSPRLLRLGTDPVAVRISTQNGPVSIATTK